VEVQAVVRKKTMLPNSGPTVVGDLVITENGAITTEVVNANGESKIVDLSSMTPEEIEAFNKLSPSDKEVLKAKLAEQATESQRLEEELLHQKNKRAQALRDRLEKKKESRVAELTQEGLDEEEALAKAEEEKATEEVEEIAKIDQEIKEEVAADRAKKLSDAISLYTDKDRDRDVLKAKVAEQEAESTRLANELQYQKDKRAQALKDRLEKKKGSRVAEVQKELGVNVEEAALKVALEVAEEEAAEIARINDDFAEELKKTELEKTKKLDDLCDAEAQRIAMEVEAQRQAKLAELQVSLEAEREKLKASGLSEQDVETALEEKQSLLENDIEKDLLAKAEKRRLAMVQAIRDEHLKSSENLQNVLAVQKDQKAKALKDRLNKKKQVRTAEMMKEGVDIDQAVAMAKQEAEDELEVETKKLDKEAILKQREAGELALQAIRAAQEKEATRLEQDMIHQESRQKKNLQDRLKKREKKREESLEAEGVSKEDAKQIAEQEKKAEELRQTKALEEEIAEIKRVQEVEAKKLSDVKAAKQDSTKKALQERLAKKKAKKEREATPEQLMEQYLQTVRSEQKEALNKLVLFVDEQKKKAMAQADSDAADPLHVAMLFTAVKENMIVGYKKQCVYQVRALKEKLATAPLAPEDHRAAMQLASDNLMSIHNKEMKSIIDTQLAEQQKVKAKLAEDSASLTKVLEMEEKFYRRNVDVVRKQNTKLFFTLAGIHLDLTHFLTNYHDGSDAQHNDEEDEDDIFGEKSNKHVFSNEASEWFQGAMSLHQAYDKIPVALLTTFQEILLDVQSGASLIPKAEGGVAGAVFYNLTLVLLQVIGTSFHQSVVDFDTVSTFTSIDQSNVGTQLSRASDSFSVTLEDVYIVMEKQVSNEVQTPFRAAIKAFISSPMTENVKFFQKMESIKEQTAKAAEKVQKSSHAVIENIDRSNRILKTLEGKVEKRKREIMEKYRRAKEGKERECKDAGIDMPANFVAEQDLACEEEISKLKMSFNDVRDEVSENTDKLQQVNADGLMFAIEKKIKGETVEAKDFKTLQEELEKENEKAEAKKLLQAQQDEAEKLDVMLKVQKAREQQALQKRLLERKNKKKNVE